MFTRTNSGISNKSLFSSATHTLYVEGGGGVAGAGSPDRIFWEDILRQVRPDIKPKIEVFGGKPELEVIARKVEHQEVSNVIVAMDADFDEWAGAKVFHPNIVYTHGYSWENDAYCLENIKFVIYRLSRGRDIENADLETVIDEMTNYLDQFRPWVYADYWLRLMNSSLFSDLPTGTFISYRARENTLNIDQRRIRREFTDRLVAIDNRNPPTRRCRRPRIAVPTPSRFLHGHTLQFLMERLLSYALARLGVNMKMNPILLETNSLAALGIRINEEMDDTCVYYREKLRDIV